MFIVATAGLLVSMALAMARALLGPTVYDRVMALNMFGTKTVILIAVLGFLVGRPEFLDLALVYALINFIGTVAVLKFFEVVSCFQPLPYQGILWVRNFLKLK